MALVPEVPYAEEAVPSHPADEAYIPIFNMREESHLVFAFMFLYNVCVYISEWHNVLVFMKHELITSVSIFLSSLSAVLVCFLVLYIHIHAHNIFISA